MFNPDNSSVIHFPFMFEELVPEELRSRAMFLNPGLGEQGRRFFTPSNLVLDSKQAHNYLEWCSSFGRQFRKPSDMACLGARGPENFYSETTMSIRWQLSTYDDQADDDSDARGLLKAQQLLLLEYFLEEKLVDLKTIDQQLGASWKDFDQCVGVEHAGESFFQADRASLARKVDFARWPRLLWAFAQFVPEDSFLLVANPELAQEMMEAGLVLEKLVDDFHQAGRDHSPRSHLARLNPGGRDQYLKMIQQPMQFIIMETSG
ncbi:MAG: hypothetical protein ACOCV7_00420 [Desulfonatronovibrionaceae bacterium]